ncbi:hypothetical protein, partial [Mycobacterium avium]|uniref:hypothetical protein n=1 Tax=Mycobacterium avium TaxID=1764 RepID=UPI003F684D72
MKELVGQTIQPGEDGHEFVAVHREDAEDRGEILRHLDQLVGVVVEGLPVDAEGVVGAGDQRPELLALRDQGLHRSARVV